MRTFAKLMEVDEEITTTTTTEIEQQRSDSILYTHTQVPKRMFATKPKQ